jgi:hypothetical protein
MVWFLINFFYNDFSTIIRGEDLFSENWISIDKNRFINYLISNLCYNNQNLFVWPVAELLKKDYVINEFSMGKI